MIRPLILHAFRLYGFSHTGEGLPARKSSLHLTIAVVLFLITCPLAAYSDAVISFVGAGEVKPFSHWVADAAIRLFFAFVIAWAFFGAKRFLAAILLMTLVHAVAAAALHAGPWIGIQAASAVSLAFTMWSVVAFFKFKPVEQAEPEDKPLAKHDSNESLNPVAKPASVESGISAGGRP